MRRLLEDQSGISLIETLIAVAIMTVSFGAILGGIWSSIFASEVHREQATAQATLSSYAEAVKKTDFVACATSSSYQNPAGFTQRTNYPATVTAVRFVDTATPGAVLEDCPADPTGVVQVVSLKVTSTIVQTNDGAPVSFEVDVVKRNGAYTP